MAVAYGTDSAWYISKVLARFAKGQANKTIPAGLVTASRLGTKDGADLDKRSLTPAGSRVRLGVDLAQGGGDELVVALSAGRLARVVRSQRGEANVNTFAVAGYIKEEIERANFRSTSGLVGVCGAPLTRRFWGVGFSSSGFSSSVLIACPTGLRFSRAWLTVDWRTTVFGMPGSVSGDGFSVSCLTGAAACALGAPTSGRGFSGARARCGAR
jgi:hypothetical protein